MDVSSYACLYVGVVVDRVWETRKWSIRKQKEALRKWNKRDYGTHICMLAYTHTHDWKIGSINFGETGTEGLYSSILSPFRSHPLYFIS